MTTLEILKQAKAASPALAMLNTEQKNVALLALANALENESDTILAANALDIEAAMGTMNDVMIDRLRLTADRIHGMAQGIREVVELPDPVGSVIETVNRPNGLTIEKTRAPMGVVGIIYESLSLIHI